MRMSVEFRACLVRGQQYAHAAGNARIDAVHWLAGILSLDSGNALQLLWILHIDVPRLREEIIPQVESGRLGEAPRIAMPQTGPARSVLRRALAECAARRGEILSTEDLLMALLADGGAGIQERIRKYGLTYQLVHHCAEAANLPAEKERSEGTEKGTS